MDVSLERAKSDLEIVMAAYPDEVRVISENGEIVSISSADITSRHSSFPLRFELSLFLLPNDGILCCHAEQGSLPSSSMDSFLLGATIAMEMNEGYPVDRGIEVVSYRIMNRSRVSKNVLELTVQSVRDVAAELLEIGEECALSCCIAAQQSWSDNIQADALIINGKVIADETQRQINKELRERADNDIHWIAGRDGCGIITDRKSTFQAFVCFVNDEDMVSRALKKLISGSRKVQKATHNMVSNGLNIPLV